MPKNYANDLALVKSLLNSDITEWNKLIAFSLEKTKTWKNSMVDHESTVNEALFKAASTYKPICSFRGYLITVTKNMLRARYRDMKPIRDLAAGPLEWAEEAPYKTTDHLDKLIARETVTRVMDDPTEDGFVMAHLMMAGMGRSKAAKIMGITRFKARDINEKLKEKL